jgi:hypothetical protein
MAIEPLPPSSLTCRWTPWQARHLAAGLLTPDMAAQGYTVVQVRPQLRPAFFATVDLLQARLQWEDQLCALLADPARGPTLAEAQAAWTAWQTWTRRLAAYLARVAAGQDGTCPPVPEALRALGDEEATADG